MNLKEIKTYLDRLILVSNSKVDFMLLSKEERVIAATKMLISITMRSGIDLFFKKRNKYLWDYAKKGLVIFGGVISIKYFNVVIKIIEEGKGNRYWLKKTTTIPNN